MESATAPPSPPGPTHRALHVLLGVTGSVAAVKAPELAVRIVRGTSPRGAGVVVKVLLTAGGAAFWDKAQAYDAAAWSDLLEEIERRRIVVLDAAAEWRAWRALGDPVLHIELRDWADLLLVAPLSAHTLAKAAHGLCDDTLSCVLRAWEFGRRRPGDGGGAKPLILAPAMNTAMWEHVLTRRQLDAVRGFFPDGAAGDCFRVIAPQAKLLACGEYGVGALAEVSDIVACLYETVEALDAVVPVAAAEVSTEPAAPRGPDCP